MKWNWIWGKLYLILMDLYDWVHHEIEFILNCASFLAWMSEQWVILKCISLTQAHAQIDPRRTLSPCPFACRLYDLDWVNNNYNWYGWRKHLLWSVAKTGDSTLAAMLNKVCSKRAQMGHSHTGIEWLWLALIIITAGDTASSFRSFIKNRHNKKILGNYTLYKLALLHRSIRLKQ